MTESTPYDSISDLPRTVPIFPLGGALLLPHGRLPLNIFEPRYLAMIDDALARDRVIGMVQPRDNQSAVGKPEVYGTGCLGRLTSFSETPDGRYLITLTGICRFRIGEELESVTPYRQVLASYGPFEEDISDLDGETPIPREKLLASLKIYLEKFELEADWSSIEQAPAEALVNSLAMICPFEQGEKQALLEAVTLKDRADTLVALLDMACAGGTDDDMPMQ